MPEKQKDFTIDEVAEIMQVHRNTVENLINAGKLEAYTIGRSKRITLRAMNKFRRENPAKTKNATKVEKPAGERKSEKAA